MARAVRPGWRCLVAAAALLTGAGGARLAPDKDELMNACYFAYALRLDLPGSNHHMIRGSDFQRKISDFYGGLATSPPLEEAYWLLALPSDFQETILSECPAMVVLSYLLVGETKLYLEPDRAEEFAQIGVGLLRKLSPRLTSMMMDSWPLEAAIERFQATQLGIRKLQAATPQVPSLDFVVAHCREDLAWLRQALPHWTRGLRARLILYEKCGEQGDAGGLVPTSHVQVPDDGPGGRKDECSAYLTHLAHVAQGGGQARYTIFLQSDALHHSTPQLLNLVMHSIRTRGLDVPFLHLSRATMVASTSPCKRAIFEQVMGHAPEGVLRGYCCAQFLARDDTIARAGAVWQRALEAMDQPLPEGCVGVRLGAGMHCLAYESMWHAMFGTPEQLSQRSQDTSLPVFLRVPDNDVSDLPGGSNYTMYFNNALGEAGDVTWLDHLDLGDAVDLTGARSIGYSAVTPGAT